MKMDYQIGDTRRMIENMGDMQRPQVLVGTGSVCKVGKCMKCSAEIVIPPSTKVNCYCPHCWMRTDLVKKKSRTVNMMMCRKV